MIFDENGNVVVSFWFNLMGVCKFGEYMLENINLFFVIVLDNEVVSVLIICLVIIGGLGIIIGSFLIEEIMNFVVLLWVGVLLVELVFLEEWIIGLELGVDSVCVG